MKLDSLIITNKISIHCDKRKTSANDSPKPKVSVFGRDVK